MKSRIILFIITVLTINSLSVLYGDETKTLTSVKYATTISEANAVLHLALKDKRLKAAQKKQAKNVYKEVKRSNDPTLINAAYKAYLNAQRQEKLAILAYEKAKKIESDLKRDMKMKGKALALNSLRTNKAKNYVEYTLLLEKEKETKVCLFGYIAKLFNIDLDGEITLGENMTPSDTNAKYAMNQSANGGRNNHVSIIARKTIMEW